MCNAWNHPPGCTCGWGGDGHLGRSPGCTVPHRLGRFSWQHRDEDFCCPSNCPRCGASVYFVRHNGGSVWFDELGSPWPKHGCFDEDRYGVQLRRLLTEGPRSILGKVFGVVIETETTRPGLGGRIVIRCSHGGLIDREFNTTANLSLLPGRLVVVFHDEQGDPTLRLVTPAQPRTIAYLQLIDNRTSTVIEEFPYKERDKAEQRLLVLESQNPGRHRLKVDKR